MTTATPRCGGTHIEYKRLVKHGMGNDVAPDPQRLDPLDNSVSRFNPSF